MSMTDPDLEMNPATQSTIKRAVKTPSRIINRQHYKWLLLALAVALIVAWGTSAVSPELSYNEMDQTICLNVYRQ